MVTLALLIAACCCPLLPGAVDPPASTQPQPPPLVGVIRWDGQSGGFKKGEVGAEEERVLGPAQWHSRLPFWATTPTTDSCTLSGESQEVMDREIAYAKEAGIDYWAFCWYGDTFYLSHGRHLYLQSRHAHDVNYCVIIGKHFSEKETAQLVDGMKAANYQKVLVDRPLLYTLGLEDPQVVAGLRRRCLQEHVPNPFVVIMDWQGRGAAKLSKKIGGDGISAYTSGPPGKNAINGNNEVPYADYAADQRAQWDNWRRTRAQVIPWVNVGWDPRPRVGQTPPYLYAKAGVYGKHVYYSMSTGPQFAEHLRQCIAWVRVHPTSCQANALLCYAWNEFSEGGTICPKLSGNREHLDAMKTVTSEMKASN